MMHNKLFLLGENLDSSWDSLSYLPEDDLRFLGDMFIRFPQVKDSFEDYVGLPVLERIPKAMLDLQTKPRTGWLRLGVKPGGRDVLSTHWGEYSGPRYLLFENLFPKAESVLEHATEASELALSLYPRDEGRIFLHEMMKFHDIGEAIMTDFTPHDPIEKWEKKKLEKIGIDFLTRSRLEGDLLAYHIFSLTEVFEGRASSFRELASNMRKAVTKKRDAGHVLPHQESFVSFLENLYREGQDPDVEKFAVQGKDCDLLQMELRARRMEIEKHSPLSEDKARQKYKEFYDYVEAGVKTPEGKAFLESFRGLWEPCPGLYSFKEAYYIAVRLAEIDPDVREGLLRTKRYERSAQPS